MPGLNQENGQQVCQVHSVIWEGLQRDLKRGELTMQKQGGQLEGILLTLQEHTLAIKSMEKTLNNGLKADIENISENLNGLIKCIKGRLNDYENRVSDLERFAWFRDWVTKVRNSLFIYVVRGFCIMILVLVVVQIADLGVEQLVSSLYKLIGG